MTKIRPAGADLFYGPGRIYGRTDRHTFVAIGKLANALATAFTKHVCKLGAEFDTRLLTNGQGIQKSYKSYSLLTCLM
jgi:hypothetical protein